MPAIDPQDQRPPYVQIADDLRTAIAVGSFEVGAQVPSARELSTEYGVSHMTANNAIHLLRDEGILETIHGRGVFVCEPTGDVSRRPVHKPGVKELRAEVADLSERLLKAEAAIAELQKRR